MGKTLFRLTIICYFALAGFSVRGQDWVRKFTAPDCKLFAKAVVPTERDFFVSFLALDTTTQSYPKTVLSKIDNAGNPLWAKKFSFASDYINAFDFIKLMDGNLLFILSYGGYFGVMKTDSAGNFLWGKKYSLFYEAAYKLVETNTGDLVLAGFNDHVKVWNGCMLKLDKDGNILQYYDFVSSFRWNASLHLWDVIKTSDGGCIAIGEIEKNYPSTNIFFIKIDSIGAVSWTKFIGDGGRQSGTSIVETIDGYIFGGWNGNKLLLGKTDKQGNSVWNKTYKHIVAEWPKVMLSNNGLEISTITSTDSTWSYLRKFRQFNTDIVGNIISTYVLPDLYKYSYRSFAIAKYGVTAERILLRKEHENGFKIIKSNSIEGFKDCYTTSVPSAVVANVFQTTSVSCTSSGTITVNSFSGTSSPYLLNSEKGCNCEPDHLTHNIIGCGSERLQLSASDGDFHLWSTGQSDSNIYVDQPNLYWVQNSSSCTLTDTFKVSFSDPKADFGADKKSVTIMESVQFTNSSLNASYYNWSFGDGTSSSKINPEHKWNLPGNYPVKLTSNESICSDTFHLEIIVKGLSVPNIFTPNNDGINDYFILKTEGIEDLTCSIFDRWGKNVCIFNDPIKGWDGGEANDGTYYYIITAITDEKKVLSLKGFITLLR